MKYFIFIIINLISVIRLPFFIIKDKFNIKKAWKDASSFLNII